MMINNYVSILNPLQLNQSLETHKLKCFFKNYAEDKEKHSP